MAKKKIAAPAAPNTFTIEDATIAGSVGLANSAMALAQKKGYAPAWGDDAIIAGSNPGTVRITIPWRYKGNPLAKPQGIAATQDVNDYAINKLFKSAGYHTQVITSDGQLWFFGVSW